MFEIITKEQQLTEVDTDCTLSFDQMIIFMEYILHVSIHMFQIYAAFLTGIQNLISLNVLCYFMSVLSFVLENRIRIPTFFSFFIGLLAEMK